VAGSWIHPRPALHPSAIGAPRCRLGRRADAGRKPRSAATTPGPPGCGLIEGNVLIGGCRPGSHRRPRRRPRPGADEGRRRDRCGELVGQRLHRREPRGGIAAQPAGASARASAGGAGAAVSEAALRGGGQRPGAVVVRAGLSHSGLGAAEGARGERVAGSWIHPPPYSPSLGDRAPRYRPGRRADADRGDTRGRRADAARSPRSAAMTPGPTGSGSIEGNVLFGGCRPYPRRWRRSTRAGRARSGRGAEAALRGRGDKDQAPVLARAEPLALRPGWRGGRARGRLAGSWIGPRLGRGSQPRRRLASRRRAAAWVGRAR